MSVEDLSMRLTEEGPQEEQSQLGVSTTATLMVKRVAKRVAWVLLIATTVPTLITMVGAVLWGVLHAAISGYMQLLQQQYNAVFKLVLHSILPEPEPEPDFFEKMVKHSLELIRRVDLNILAILLVAIAILVSIWMISFFGYYFIRSLTMRMRGIQYEAMRPGSIFTAGEIPKCQVRIMIPGLLMDSHQGYGIRVGNWMVAPLHVVSGQRDIVVVGPRGKILINVQYEESRIHPDVAYLWLEDKQWVTLGNSSSKTTPALNGYARSYGPKGYSSGTISKTRTAGVIKYSGSTISGMSGAAYMMADRVMGMHTGASGDFNLGVSTTLFVNELKYKMKSEAVYIPSKGNGEDAAFIRTEDTWTSKFMEKLAKDSALDTSYRGWTDNNEIDFDQKFDWESEKKPKNPIKLATLMMDHQGNDGGSAEYQLIGKDFITEFEEFKDRVVILEDYVKAQIVQKEKVKKVKEEVVYQCDQCSAKATSATDLEAHKKKHLKFKCDLCSIECVSSIKLANHVANSHRTVIGESAYPGDARVLVETKTTDTFLGKRSSSPKTRRQSSRKSSSTLATKRDSPHLESLLLRVIESQESIVKYLREAPKATGGPSSGTQLR